jgi:hypothetical protein
MALFAALALLSSAAAAHGRVAVGISFGFPLYYPYWYYPVVPVYYPQPSPPVYVEKNDDHWYYCEQTRAYYPYVKECVGGWKRVPPAPAPAR